MARSESTIATAKALDVTTLMSKDFDLESYLGADKSSQLNLLSKHIDKGELVNDLKMTAFLQDIGINGKDDLSANKMAMKSAFNETNSSGLWGSIKEGWQNNQIQIQIADIRFAEMSNQIPPDQAQLQVDALKKQMKDTKSKGFASWAKSAANLMPMIIETSSEGVEAALAAGLPAAGTTAIAGQAGPQVTIPEEIVTVPAAFLTFGGIGMAYGSSKRAAELEAGLFYDELLSMTDAQGNKLDPNITKPIAATLGVINGLLELVQIGDIVKTIPGGKKLIAKAQRKTIKNVIKSKSVLKLLINATGRYSGHVGFETAIEVVQEADNIIMGELTKNINNQLHKTDMKPAEIAEITNRIVETAKESAKGFSLIAGPGNLIQTTIEVAETPEKAPAGVVKPVKRVSRISTSEKITTRIDVEQLGKTMVDIEPELPPKKSRKKTERVKVLTPEEEYQLQQTEATLEAEEPHIITPRLYIGNVTQRMKKVWGAVLGVDPEAVHGFLEGAFPTIRTKIELTMGEARHLLTHLESSLQERLDKNQINTENDLARANADWGDIKELRHKLGLPKETRPFKVVRNPQTEVVTIENVKERIEKAVQPSKLDVLKLSQTERLNQVMRRAAHYAKEGYVKGKAEMRRVYAELKYLRKQKELRDKLISSIQKEPSKRIDFFYREAIRGIQDAIDFGGTTEEKLVQKETLKKLLKDNPDKITEIPQEILDTLDKKDISTLSYTDLLMLNDEIKRLTQLGRLKSELYRKQRARALKTERKAMISNIEKAPKNILPSKERANTLRPTRIFDMLDGGKKMAGRIFNFFYRQTNEDFNNELSNSDNRLSAMKQKLGELGLSLRDLTKKRIIGEYKLTVDEILSVYAGWKNPASQAALRYGGIPQIVDGKETYIEVTDTLYKQIEESLTDKEKLWADTIIAEYQEHYGRMRNTVIQAENRDPGNEVNYTKIRRKNTQYKSTEQEILDELALRHFFSQVGPHKAFTLKRQNIPAEYQRPMELGLTKIWMGEVRKQEHYINNVIHLKDMRAITRNTDFRDVVERRFGKPILDTIDHYLDSIANPDFYKTFSDIEQASRLLRKHTAIAYIAFNVSSYMKQIPSLMMYWANSSVADIIISTLDSLFHPMQTYESAKNIHYQISHQFIEREMMELERTDKNAYKKIINAIGRAGMYGIFAVDRATRVIGINAVYNKAIRDGLSPSEAAQKAAMVTLTVQEAAAPKDLAKLYSSSEFLNWFTMFTNQLNQIYNITTYDIPVAWRNKNYSEAARSAIALGTMALMIWTIEHPGEIPDEPEEIAAGLSDQAVSSMPLIGNYIIAGAKGWSPSAPAPLKVAGGLGKTGMAVYEKDYEKALKQMAEPLAIGAGFPYQGAKDLVSFIEEME